MTKTLIAVFPEDKHTHLFEKFTQQFKKLKGKFDVIFVVSKQNYKYLEELEKTKLKTLRNKEKFDNELEQAVSNRNLLRDYALEEGYSHVLFLDSDVLMPKDILIRLLEKDKEIITAAYLNVLMYKGQQIIAPPMYKLIEDNYLQLLRPEALNEPRMIKIGAAALSCCLIKREVLERITFRKPYRALSETISFFEDAVKALGYDAWLDTSIKCARQPYPEGDERNVLFQTD
ncbi:hypothetical protein DRJ25_03180 [Candidatus Woesearchaeota archaeon]|nr:MAG: hypothetical protein DRJ25_03180 [Candidatus Woesearchaeota archaeon]